MAGDEFWEINAKLQPWHMVKTKPFVQAPQSICKSQIMKNLLSALLIAAFLIACKDDEPNHASDIQGTWQWVSSLDTEVSQTHTPTTDVVTRHIEIDDDTYREFVNDSLIRTSSYVFEVLPDSTFGSDKVLNMHPGNDFAVIQRGDSLRLVEIRLHNWEHVYVRD
jgi:hypothetical protein